MKADGRFATAIHVLALLAYKNGDPVCSDFIALSVNTNPVMIRRLLLDLQRAKLIETRKGPGCGSRLSRSPARINMAEVYRAVTCAEPFGMPCRKPNPRCPVGRAIRNVLKAVFTSARSALEQDLARISLASVLDSLSLPEAQRPALPASFGPEASHLFESSRIHPQRDTERPGA